MSEKISAEVSDRICKHMNDDHGDALVLYARAFGGVEQAIAAQMLNISAEEMNLLVQTETNTSMAQIPFNPPLKDAEDAHHTLIDMVKQARDRLK